jgi:TRAP-type C4-dicarboxylate transport system substrate-binding protein
VLRPLASATALATLSVLAGCLDPEAAPADDDPELITKAATVVTCRTTAPIGGEIARQLRIVSDNVRVETGGRVELRWYASSPSDETVATGLRTTGGCALLTSHDLGGLSRDRLALRLPGLYTSWTDLDDARDAIQPLITQGLAARGIVWLGEVDIGSARIVGTERTGAPRDLRGRTVARAPGELVVLRTAAGLGMTARTLGDGEVATHLGHGLSTLIASPLRVEQMQWTGRLDHVLDGVAPWFETGSLVIAQPTLAALRADDRETLRTFAAFHAEEISERNRSLDAAARRQLTDRLQVTAPTAAERADWRSALAAVRAGLLPELARAVRDRVCAQRSC